ncbi:MAG TPA: hypothetical protein VHB25_15660 [Gemmatimonadaceae bacterium]|nr:hypothetical protein [Gemmatimonadaceae bacterium]
MASDRFTVLKRIGVAILAVAALAFAVQGGEFSTLDLFRQRRAKARLSHQVDSLRHVVDSLRQYENLVEHDPRTQERIAREVFGMVRGNKELLYRFTTPGDTTNRTP